MIRLRHYPVINIFFHLMALLPLVWLVYALNFDKLSADPAKDIQHFTGITALRLLILIAVIPAAAHYLKWNSLYQTRKLLGLWCFTWATLHLASYLLLEIGINNIALFLSEIISRFYLILGATGWIILFLMAVSSFNPVRIRLGGWWKRIHSLLYPLLLIAILHYILSVKTNTPEPFLYLILIISAYLYRFRQQRKSRNTGI